MLKLNHVSMTFNPGTVNEKKALNDLSLHLAPGDFATIVGSNGAGKSTLFGAIAGSFWPDTGSVVLDGQDITFLPAHVRSKQIGHLFQDPMRGTAPHMTIEENLALAYLRTEKSKSSFFSRVNKKDKELFREHLALLGMGLEDRMSQPVGLLSGGQRQALTLLMATLVTPKLLLLDEHTAALDPATAEKVLALTRDIVAQRHITCLMITHNMHSALELGNRTLMMNAGRIVLDVQGEERAHMTVDDLLARFAAGAGQALDNDRILLSSEARKNRQKNASAPGANLASGGQSRYNKRSMASLRAGPSFLRSGWAAALAGPEILLEYGRPHCGLCPLREEGYKIGNHGKSAPHPLLR